MIDLMYFGYEWESDSQTLEQEFKELVVKLFPDVKLEDAYDSIKGYRQEVYLPDEQKDDYLAWIIADGWAKVSLTMQLMMMSDKIEWLRLFELAKKHYPQNFKKVTNSAQES